MKDDFTTDEITNGYYIDENESVICRECKTHSFRCYSTDGFDTYLGTNCCMDGLVTEDEYNGN